MRVLIIGSGRIGCGYLAPLFQSEGWDLVLATRTKKVARRIRKAAKFSARITRTGGWQGPRKITMRPVGAVATSAGGFAHAVAEADLICTAVGVTAVDGLAEPLAHALAARPRGRAIDVVTVENDDCAPRLADGVERIARSAGVRLPPTGFAGGVATVAVARGDWRGKGAVRFVGDGARGLIVDQTRLVAGRAFPSEVVLTPDYLPRLREKLYVFNAGHAICGYLGWLRGHRTVAEAVADPLLRPMVVGCLLEARRALLQAYPELGEEVRDPVAAVLERYADPELTDPLARVAREPIRKLAPHDRLLGPVALVRRALGVVPPYFSLAVAGALLYRGGDDPQALTLQSRLADEGVMAVLASVCGLEPDDPFAVSVAEHYRGFILAPKETIFPPAHSPGDLADAAL